ncbi:MAG: PEP-CTERM sorting domain-containing protein, partial [Moorea sp. SIO3G5]|nr:PEP-CTERM sorting domain-containing protein [Moorena sp. SIO3G5]
GDFIYESARKVVGAQIQVITYNEFLPLFIGDSLLDDYSGYDPTVDPSISQEFTNANFRVGHTLLSDELQRINNNGDSVGSISLGDAFFNPQEVIDNGVDSLFLGLASQVAEEVDNQIVDGVRNFLAPNGSGQGFDLASLNIARGREVGLPGYNQARVELGLDPVTAFLTTDTELGITSNPEVAALFEDIYKSVDDVDFWIGGISEDSFNGGLVGELFNSFISDQFRRVRDGDRFFFLNDLDHLLALAPDLESTTLSGIIRRNSTITNIQDNAFVVPEDVPEPTSIVGLVTLLGLAAIGQRSGNKK